MVWKDDVLKNYQKLQSLKKIERQRFIEAEFTKLADEFWGWLESEVEEEIWKDIEDYEGYYQVSNRGRVKSLERIMPSPITKSGFQTLKTKILKPSLNLKGYQIVFLNKDGKKKTVLVHRLVAFAFCDGYMDTDPPMEVNHKNGKHTDNDASNLEWVTPKENQEHAQDMGFRGSKHGKDI